MGIDISPNLNISELWVKFGVLKLMFQYYVFRCIFQSIIHFESLVS